MAVHSIEQERSVTDRLASIAQHLEAARLVLMAAAKDADHEEISSIFHRDILFLMDGCRDAAGTCVEIVEAGQ